jgi:hypothetical protein
VLNFIAFYERSLLYLTIIQGAFGVLSVSAYKGWQYLIEGQRQRATAHITWLIREGMDVKLQDRRSLLHIRSDISTEGAYPQGPPPKQDGGPILADIIILDVYRQRKSSKETWAPPA